MKDIFIARQPIFDRNLEVYGYEILFRDGKENRANVKNDDVASIRVLAHTFSDIGIDVVTDNHPAFINLTRKILIDSNPPPFPKSKIVIELLENQVYDDILLEQVKVLKKHGYTVALDDFVYDEKFNEFIKLADIVKLDVLALTSKDIAEHANILKPFDVKLLAEKIEDYAMLEFCKHLGFDYFQGYFLSQPAMITGKREPITYAETLELISKFLQPKVTTEQLITAIKDKARFKYKFLLAINALGNGTDEYDNLNDVAKNLNHQEFINFLCTIALYKIKNKPRELFINTIERAKMCEVVAKAKNITNKDLSFFVGLLSNAGAILDLSLKEICSRFNLAKPIAGALLKNEGELGKILEMVVAYERGSFSQVYDLNISANVLSESYLSAIKFSETICSVLYSKPKK